jgi:anti-sigma-K factor RskA
LANQIRNAPDAVSVTQQVPGGGELTLVRSPSLGRAVLVGHDVPDAPDGKTYQMWLQQPGQDMVSAGLMPDADEPTVLTGDAATAKAAAVSIEPEAGSVHPSKDVIAVFPLQAGGSANGSA